MLCLTSGTVLERRLGTPDDLLETVMMQSVVTAVVLWVLAAVTGRVAAPTDLDFWAAVAWLIVLASLGGYGIYVHVARTQGATVVSTLLYLTPPTTMVWAYLMFGTPLTLVAAAGLAVSARRRGAGAPRTTCPGACAEVALRRDRRSAAQRLLRSG